VRPAFLAFVGAMLSFGGLLAAEEAGRVIRLDFQPEGAPVAPLFVPLTPFMTYTGQRGYGWEGGATGRGIQATLPDSLTGDCIFQPTAALRVDVPRGTYDICFWTGSFASEVPYPPAAPFGVFVEEQAVPLVNISAGTLWREWLSQGRSAQPAADCDLWTSLVAERLPVFRMRLQATDGVIRLRFWGPIAVSAVVISPGEEDEFRRILDQIEANRREEFQRLVEIVATEPVAPSATTVDEKAGFVLTLSGGQGSPEPLPETLDTFAAQGQTASLSFCFYALRELQWVVISLEELAASRRARLARSAVEVFTVRQTLDGRTPCRWMQHALEPWQPHSLRAGSMTEVRIRIHVPVPTAAGIYRGRLTIRAKNGGKRSISVALRVLPFTLPDFSSGEEIGRRPVLFAYWEHPPGSKQEDEVTFFARQGFAPYMTMGATGHSHPQSASEVVADFCGRARALRVAGWKAEIGWDDFQHWVGLGESWRRRPSTSRARTEAKTIPETAGLRSLVSALTNALKEAQLDPHSVYLTAAYHAGRATGPSGADTERSLLTVLRQLSPCAYLTFPGEAWELDLGEVLGHVVVGDAIPADFATLDELRQRQQPLAFAPRSSGRFAVGFFAWRVGARIVMCGTGWRNQGAPSNPLDGQESEAFYLAMPTERGLVPTVHGEAVREGANDLRYVILLERLLAETAKMSGSIPKAVLGRAQAVYQALRDGIRPSWDFYERQGVPSDATLDAMRWDVAGAIIAIQDALRDASR